MILSLLLLAVLYAVGSRRLRSRVASRRQRLEALTFWTGWGTLAIALLSPLHEMAEALFSAHMAQHELIMLVAAPLIVLGQPLVAILWALPARPRLALSRSGAAKWMSRLWSGLTRMDVAWTLHAGALLAWHLPALYQRSVESEMIHALQHLSFFGTGILFWWSVVHGGRSRHGVGVLAVFGMAVLTGGLGALLTVSQRVWYPLYAGRTAGWGLTPLEDQQLAGLIMWVPGGLAYLIAALALALAWLSESEARVLRWERAR
jgi:putative membrane protein